MKKEYKKVIYSFLLPFIVILMIIATSFLTINYFKDIQKEAIITIYKWKKVISYASQRFRIEGTTSSEIYTQYIDEFDISLYRLREVLPERILVDVLNRELNSSIDFWEYIKTILSKNDSTPGKSLGWAIKLAS